MAHRATFVNVCVFKHTSCWSNTRSMSSALMCCLFPWSCLKKYDMLNLPYCWWQSVALLHFCNSPCFPWTSWQEWSFSSASQTLFCEYLGKTWGHWWSIIGQTQKGHCQSLGVTLQGRIITFHTWIIEKSQELGTLMMTKSDFVSSSECSRMWSGLGQVQMH